MSATCPECEEALEPAAIVCEDCVAPLSEGLFGRRVQAVLVDLALALLPLPILAWLWFSVLNSSVRGLLLIALLAAPLLAIGLLYHAVLAWGASYGMMLQGLRVVSQQGSKPHALAALVAAFPGRASRRAGLILSMAGSEPAAVVALPGSRRPAALALAAGYLVAVILVIGVGWTHRRATVQDWLDSAYSESHGTRSQRDAAAKRFTWNDIQPYLNQLNDEQRAELLNMAIFNARSADFEALRAEVLRQDDPYFLLGALLRKGDKACADALLTLLPTAKSEVLQQLRIGGSGFRHEQAALRFFHAAEPLTRIRLRHDLESLVRDPQTLVPLLEEAASTVLARGNSAERAGAFEILLASEDEGCVLLALAGLGEGDKSAFASRVREAARERPKLWLRRAEAALPTALSAWPYAEVLIAAHRRGPRFDTDAMEDSIVPLLCTMLAGEDPKAQQQAVETVSHFGPILESCAKGASRRIYATLIELLDDRDEDQAQRMGYLLRTWTVSD